MVRLVLLATLLLILDASAYAQSPWNESPPILGPYYGNSGPFYPSTSPSTISGNVFIGNPDLVILDDTYRRIVIQRPANCTLVVLESGTKQVIIGCRKELP